MIAYSHQINLHNVFVLFLQCPHRGSLYLQLDIVVIILQSYIVIYVCSIRFT